MKRFIFFALIFVLVFSQQSKLQKVLLKEPEALCLDGSPGAYYIERGKSPQKILLYFEGGGWCGSSNLNTTIHDCYARSKIDLGSSKNYPQTISFADGILSNNQKNSFKQYTKVFLRYCDGSGHQGSKSAPIQYQGSKLYFRGHNITVNTFNEIQKTQGIFSKATTIIVSGSSAGGLAAYLWVDYVKSKAKAQHVYAAPDSGIFLDSLNHKTKQYDFRSRFISLTRIVNVQIAPPIAQCAKAFQNQLYKCMFVEYMHKFIKTPIFAIQSLYDSYSIPSILGIDCVTGTSLENCQGQELKLIQQYHRNTSIVLNSIGAQGHNGFWAPACAIHTFTRNEHYYSPSYRVPMESNNSIDQTLFKWINQPTVSHKYIDTSPWPSNKPCSGKTKIENNYLQIDQ